MAPKRDPERMLVAATFLGEGDDARPFALVIHARGPNVEKGVRDDGPEGDWRNSPITVDPRKGGLPLDAVGLFVWEGQVEWDDGGPMYEGAWRRPTIAEATWAATENPSAPLWGPSRIREEEEEAMRQEAEFWEQEGPAAAAEAKEAGDAGEPE